MLHWCKLCCYQYSASKYTPIRLIVSHFPMHMSWIYTTMYSCMQNSYLPTKKKRTNKLIFIARWRKRSKPGFINTFLSVAYVSQRVLFVMLFAVCWSGITVFLYEWQCDQFHCMTSKDLKAQLYWDTPYAKKTAIHGFCPNVFNAMR